MWFSLCRDYNPKQSECGMALTRLYLSYGSLDLAFNEINLIIRNGREDRAMLNWYKSWDCDVPSVAFVIYSHYVRIYQVNKATIGDALYILLLVSLILFSTSTNEATSHVFI